MGENIYCAKPQFIMLVYYKHMLKYDYSFTLPIRFVCPREKNAHSDILITINFLTGVGYRVGGRTGINYLIVGMHYKNKFRRKPLRWIMSILTHYNYNLKNKASHITTKLMFHDNSFNFWKSNYRIHIAK